MNSTIAYEAEFCSKEWDEKIHRNKPSKRIMVLDTSAFLAGFDPLAVNEEQITVPNVQEEIRSNSMTALRFGTAVENGKLRIKAPDGESLNKAKSAANSVGDSYYLSETDTQLLALSLELKSAGYDPQIISDDYSIQNVAAKMGIDFAALATFGIRRLLEWVRYCPACHKEYAADAGAATCMVCGTQLKRKPRRTTKNLKSTS
ncbi:MAG: DNA-binding protein [Candidatus Bathyarchaeota archaeon]|nr:DNA-binding protein [Candidatus Bathyarchaeota archaeon]